MYIYKKDGKIMACSEEKQDFSEFGYQCEKTDEEILQINGKLYRASEAPKPSQAELEFEEKQGLLQYLKGTDYVVIKIAEGEATAEDYADILQKRKQARARINEIDGGKDDSIE